MLRLKNRSGFALPMAILAIALLTVAITASFMLTSTERKVNNNQESQTRAFTMAQAGLERFLVNKTAMMGAGTEPTDTGSTKMPFGLDTAFIQWKKIRNASADGTTQKLYAIQSRAVYRARRVAGAPIAERTVAQLTIWQPSTMQVLAGWTSLSGLKKNGNSGAISGVDACPVGQGGGKPTVAGLAVPTGGYDGKLAPLEGSPQLLSLGTQAQANATVKINWDAITIDNAIPADFEIPRDSWATVAAALAANPNFWPIIIVNNDAGGAYAIQDGRGMLIIRGDATISGSTEWKGIMLIGGNLTSNGNNGVQGAVVTGLDNKLGEDEIRNHPEHFDADGNSIANGTKAFYYNSCAVAAATAAMGTLRAYPNAWTDSWATY